MLAFSILLKTMLLFSLLCPEVCLTHTCLDLLLSTPQRFNLVEATNFMLSVELLLNRKAF